MTVTNTEFHLNLKHGVDLLTDTIKVALVASYTFDDTDEFWSDVSSTEITGTGYTAGGVTLSSVTASYNSGTKVWTFDCANPTWTTATFTADGAVVYQSTGTDSTSVLLAYTDFGGSQSPVADTFTLTVPSGGIFTRTVS